MSARLVDRPIVLGRSRWECTRRHWLLNNCRRGRQADATRKHAERKGGKRYKRLGRRRKQEARESAAPFAWISRTHSIPVCSLHMPAPRPYCCFYICERRCSI